MSLALCPGPQVMSQVSQHFRSSEKQAAGVGRFARRSACSVVSLDSGVKVDTGVYSNPRAQDVILSLLARCMPMRPETEEYFITSYHCVYACLLRFWKLDTYQCPQRIIAPRHKRCQIKCCVSKYVKHLYFGKLRHLRASVEIFFLGKLVVCSFGL